jgi:hypothetical protein
MDVLLGLTGSIVHSTISRGRAVHAQTNELSAIR